MSFVSIDKPHSHYAEAIEVIRNALLMSRVDAQSKLFMLVSTWPSEGKSTITREMAATFGAHGSKVLLIDGDLRKPTQHIRMKLRLEPGLTSVLAGVATFDEAVQKPEGAENLWVLTAGPVPPRASVLWSSQKMRELLAECRERFDYVFLDSAPVLSVADSAIAASLADSIMLVIRHQKTDQRSILQAVTQLNRVGANIVGFVLNAVDTRWSRYSSYYQNYYGDENTETKRGKI